MSENREPTEDELIAFMIMNLSEMHVIDNGDGTSTMTFVVKVGEDVREFTTLMEVPLSDMMGESLKAVLASDLLKTYEDKATVIPNSPEEA